MHDLPYDLKCLLLQFPATAVGDNSSASVVLRNSSSSATYEFEVGVPQGSYLQVGGCAR